MREKICIDDNWLFHLGDLKKEIPKTKGPIYISSKSETEKWSPAARYYDDKSDSYDDNRALNCDCWKIVNLPHDYMINKTVDKNSNNTRGYVEYENAWYRKHLKISKEDEGKRITLYFEGIATQSDIYVNGHIMKHNYCGYNPFEVDITDVLEYDETALNVVAVYTKSKEHNGWWYEGGGICRHVWLQKTSPVCMETYGLYVLPQKVGETAWRVLLMATVLNETAEQRTADITFRLLDGETVIGEAAESVSIAGFGKSEEKAEISIDEPRLWDVCNPYMYNAEATIALNGAECDKYTTRFGFRTFKFDCDKGFFLNGKRVQINGVCCHEGFGITGRAVPDSIQRYQIKLMKEMGANGYRTSHYPHAEVTMDALDENGFIVMNETRHFNSDEDSIEELEMLVKRDRNRPSVFMWSIGNEEPTHKNNIGVRVTKRLTAAVKRLDNSRPVTSAIDADPLNSPVALCSELIGINYNLQIWDEIKEKYPRTPIYISECCATGTTRGWYYPDNPGLGRLSAFDKDTNHWFLGREKTIAAILERPWIAGSFQWSGIEHRGETVWPRLCSASGAVDLFLNKKDAFYQNKSLWTKAPMVHILPTWNMPEREGETVRVVVYTNCESVELFQDGRSVGKQVVKPVSHAEWNICYKPGRLTAVGVKNGSEVSETIETSGAAEELKLEIVSEMPVSGKRDAVLIKCSCSDGVGRFVPDADPEITFFCDDTSVARVVGTGSDNCDHTVADSKKRKMWAGLCSVLVETTGKRGEVTLYAKASGLRPAKIKLSV